MASVWPLRGLRPVRAPRIRTANGPKPARVTQSPRLRDVCRCVVSARNALAACRCVRTAAYAIRVTTSVCVMVASLPCSGQASLVAVVRVALAGLVEDIVSRVRHEHPVANGTAGRGREASRGVQPLDEGGHRQHGVAIVWSAVGSDHLQQE
jgi:hypothetical protein